MMRVFMDELWLLPTSGLHFRTSSHLLPNRIKGCSQNWSIVTEAWDEMQPVDIYVDCVTLAYVIRGYSGWPVHSSPNALLQVRQRCIANLFKIVSWDRNG
jgi:hypothetical protein